MNRNLVQLPCIKVFSNLYLTRGKTVIELSGFICVWFLKQIFTILLLYSVDVWNEITNASTLTHTYTNAQTHISLWMNDFLSWFVFTLLSVNNEWMPLLVNKQKQIVRLTITSNENSLGKRYLWHDKRKNIW